MLTMVTIPRIILQQGTNTIFLLRDIVELEYSNEAFEDLFAPQKQEYIEDPDRESGEAFES